MRTQAFEIGGKLLARILVALGIPGEPAGRGELEQIYQVVGVEHPGADDLDLLDARDISLVDAEGDANAISFERRHRGGDGGGIFAAGQVLALDLLLGAVEERAVEGAGFSQFDFAQAFHERLGVELLDADEINFRNRRTLVEHHHQHVVIGLDAHVAEKPRVEQGADHFACPRLVENVADLDRQIVEHCSRLGTLQTFDADVFDDERIEGPGGRGNEKGRDQPREAFAIHAVLQETRRLMSLKMANAMSMRRSVRPIR